METKPKPINEAELWRQLEDVQKKMDEAIAERDAALERAEQAERGLMDLATRLARAIGYGPDDDPPPRGVDDLLVEVAWYVREYESEGR